MKNNNFARKSNFLTLGWLIVFVVGFIVVQIALFHRQQTVSKANTDINAPFNSDFTIAIIPDTQSESSAVQKAVLDWILENKVMHNIALVLHLGDITDRNSEEEWEQVRVNYSKLHGKIPYFLSLGNHDMRGSNRDTTLYNQILSSFIPQNFYTGYYESGKYENAYMIMTLGKREYIVFTLEVAPRDEVLAWANTIIKNNPTKTAIIATHSYMYRDDTRISPGDVFYPSWLSGFNDGEMIWNELVKLHKNMGFIVSGHIPGVGFRIDKGDFGNNVYQMLVDYQFEYNGGGGYIRLIKFSPSQKTMEVKTYSPYLNKYLTDERNNFTVNDIDFLPGNIILTQYLVRSGRIWTRNKIGPAFASSHWGDWIDMTESVADVGSGVITAMSSFRHPQGYTMQYLSRGGRLWSRNYISNAWTPWVDVTGNISSVGQGDITSFDSYTTDQDYIQQHMTRGGQVWSRNNQNGWSSWKNDTSLLSAVGNGTMTSLHMVVLPDGVPQQHFVRGGMLWARSKQATWGAWENHTSNIFAVGKGVISGFSTQKNVD